MKDTVMKKFASIILLACLLILPGAEQKKTAAVLAVGFGPFGGRPANGSWSATNSLKEKVAATLEVPVVWGKPGEMLAAQWEQSRPEIVLCFGEGYPGFFAVEAVARNERKPIKDVNGNLPPADKIEPQAIIPTDLLTPRDIARRLGVGKTAMYDWIARGQIRHVRVGRLIRVREADVVSYLNRNTVEQARAPRHRHGCRPKA